MKKKKAAAVLLSAAMVLSLAACGTGNNSSDKAATSGKEVTEAQADSETKGPKKVRQVKHRRSPHLYSSPGISRVCRI